MDTKTYRTERGISSRDLIEVMRTEFPKFGKPTLSMVDNPADYGVRLLEEAEALIASAFGPEFEKAPAPRRTPARRKPCRLCVYLPESQHARVKHFMEREKYATVQDLLSDLVRSWLSACENERRFG